MLTSNQLRFSVRQRGRQSSFDSSNCNRSEPRLITSHQGQRPPTQPSQHSVNLRSTKSYRKLFNEAPATEQAIKPPSRASNGRQQMLDSMAAQQKKTLLYLTQATKRLGYEHIGGDSTTTLVNNDLKPINYSSRHLSSSPKKNEQLNLSIQDNLASPLWQNKQSDVTDRKFKNIANGYQSLQMIQQLSLVSKKQGQRQSNDDYDDVKARITQQAQGQTRYLRMQTDVSEKQLLSFQLSQQSDQGERKLQFAVSKSTINQDLEQHVGDESQIQTEKKDEIEKQKNIDRLLTMAEERIARELQQRRSFSVIVENKTQQQVRTSCKSAKEDVPILDEGCLQSSVILLDKRHKELSSAGSQDKSKPDRPYAWRRSISTDNQTSDYQHNKYQAADFVPRNSMIVENTIGMGPFYQRYIKQMGQSFVKDRVRRLKETFDVVQSGQLEKRLLGTQDINNVLTQQPPTLDSLDVARTSLNKNLLSRIQRPNSLQVQREQTSSMQGSPLMNLSGIELKYRLGHGDQTLDQILNTEMNQDDILKASFHKNQEKTQKRTVAMDLKKNSVETTVDGIPICQDSVIDSKQHITINLPDTERAHTKIETQQSPTNGRYHEDSLELRHDSIHTVNEEKQALPQNHQVKAIGGRRISNQRSLDSCDEIASKELLSMSIFSTVTAQRDQVNLSITRNDIANACMHGFKQSNEDISEQLPFAEGSSSLVQGCSDKVPKRRRRLNKTQLHVKNKLVRDRVNSQQKQHQRGNSLQQESVQQLIDDTIMHMYADMPIHANNQLRGYMRKKKQRVLPIDLAVLKQKAFQQFDLIRDAEKDIERTIKTKKQIQFSQQVTTPKENKQFMYSNISSKLMPEEQTKFHEDPTHVNYKDFTDSVMNKSNFVSESVGPNLSLLKSKQKMAQRKLCKSCIEPRSHKPTIGPFKDALLPHKKSKQRGNVGQSAEDRLAADIKNGSYHTRLNHYLKITNDYQLAAVRTRRDYNMTDPSSSPENEYQSSGQKQEPAPKPAKPMTLQQKIKAVAARIKQQEPSEASLNSSRRDELRPMDSQWINFSQAASGGLIVCSSKVNSQDQTFKESLSGLTGKQENSSDFLVHAQALIQDRPYERANTSHEVMTGQTRRSQQKIIVTPQQPILRVPSSLYSIDQLNASLLEPDVNVKQEQFEIKTLEFSGVVTLARTNNSNIYKTSAGNHDSNQKATINATAQEAKYKAPITPPLHQSIPAIKARLGKQQHYTQKGGGTTKSRPSTNLRGEVERAATQQIQVTNNNGDSSDRQTLAVRDINNRFSAMTKSSQMSDFHQDQAFTMPKKYSVVGNVVKALQVDKKAAGEQHIKTATQAFEFNKSVVKGEKQVQQIPSARPQLPSKKNEQPWQALLPAMIDRSGTMNQLKLKQAQIGGPAKKLQTSMDFRKRMTQSPIKSRFRIPNELHETRKSALIIDNTQKQKSQALIQRSMDRSYLQTKEKRSNSVINDFTACDVATLGKSSLDIDSKVSNDNYKLMQKSYKMTLQVNKNLQIEGQNKQVTSIQSQIKTEVDHKQMAKRPNAAAGSQRWTSPFQKHVERSQAKKQMLQYILDHRPSEMINQTEPSPRYIEGRDYQQNILGIKQPSAAVPALPNSTTVKWLNNVEQQLPQSGRTYSMLEPWDSTSQVREDSSQNIYEYKGNDRSLPVMQQVQSQNVKRRKRYSVDQTESLSDYGHRTKTAEQIQVKRRSPYQSGDDLNGM